MSDEAAVGGELTPGVETPAAVVDLCDHCKKPKAGHKLADDCQLAGDSADQAGTNPHALLRGQVRAYRPEHQNLVLAKGPQLVGMASVVGDCNLAMNHVLRTAHNLRHLREPGRILMLNLDRLFSELCKLHQWDMKTDVLGTLEEMQRSTALACPGNPDGDSRRLVLPN